MKTIDIKGNKKLISLRINPGLLQKVHLLARKKKKTFSEIFELALNNYCFWELKNGLDQTTLQEMVHGKYKMGTRTR